MELQGKIKIIGNTQAINDKLMVWELVSSEIKKILIN